MHGKRSFLGLALIAVMFQGLLLTGCGGNSSPTGMANSGEIQLKLTNPGAISTRSALGAARSAAVAGATVLIDGVSAGVTDANGEITLQLESGTHSITISSGGVTSSAIEVTVSDGDLLTLEVEMNTDGTLAVEQDIDHNGDVDDEDEDIDLNVDDEDEDTDGEDDDGDIENDEDDEDEDEEGGDDEDDEDDDSGTRP